MREKSHFWEKVEKLSFWQHDNMRTKLLWAWSILIRNGPNLSQNWSKIGRNIQNHTTKFIRLHFLDCLSQFRKVLPASWSLQIIRWKQLHSRSIYVLCLFHLQDNNAILKLCWTVWPVSILSTPSSTHDGECPSSPSQSSATTDFKVVPESVHTVRRSGRVSRPPPRLNDFVPKWHPLNWICLMTYVC